MEQGWVKLHRKLKGNWVWEDKPFSKGQAWIDMVLTANHTSNKFFLGNEWVEVERGSFITSEVKLMNNWGWSKTKLRRFLTMLESDGMIVKKTDHKKTTITVVNYRDYNNSETEKELNKNQLETNKRPIKDTNKNDKNVNNDKNLKTLNTYIVEVDAQHSTMYKDVVGYLNEMAKTNYKHSSKATQKHINARINEGYTLEEFKTVIDNKVDEWINTDMAKYLRPETLFGTKFESYLNQSGGRDKLPYETSSMSDYHFEASAEDVFT